MAEAQNYAYILTYARTGVMTWLAHLDTMSCFERSLKRAGIPLVWSGGFNPRPKIVFALPIGLGIECRADLLEIIVSEPLDLAEAAEKITAALPEGLSVLELRPADYGNKSLMSLVKAASYRVEGPGLGLAWQDYYTKHQAGPMLVTRQHKGKVKQVDLAELLLDQEKLSADCFRFKCRAGSSANLRPDLLLSALVEHEPGVRTAAEGARIIRESLELDLPQAD
ncbi:MAG: TIGR03936 family radical SAM-associated protein [Eubacteriales bacterium]|nr:TIGR03936 family radical SAM-associated protein [Eubacteriales bacterium]